MSAVSEAEVRVRYVETDQMGIVHHSNYLIWCELARTQHMRERGASYRVLEQNGVRLPVVDARLRFRSPARYDDLVRVQAWVRSSGSRMVEFGNAVLRADDGKLLATATIKLAAIDEQGRSTTIPSEVREVLQVTPDPVRM
jgi:acyl-CoA thioester hydrolase